MKITQKLGALFRGGVQDKAESVIDDNIVTIIRQEIRDAEEALQVSKRQLNVIMVEKKQLDRESEHISTGVSKKEAEACLLHKEGEIELVEEIAEYIAREEQHREQLAESRDDLAAQEATLTRFLQESVRTLSDYRRQLSIIEAKHSSQARRRPSERQGMRLASSLSDLKQSIDRASEKQRIQQDAVNAETSMGEMLDNNGLQQRIDLQLGTELSQRTVAVLKRLQLAPQH
jgi:phage shock protein A